MLTISQDSWFLRLISSHLHLTGRQAWTTLNLGARNLAMLIWLHFPTTTLTAPELAELDPKSEAMEVEQMKAMIEKRTMIG